MLQGFLKFSKNCHNTPKISKMHWNLSEPVKFLKYEYDGYNTYMYVLNCGCTQKSKPVQVPSKSIKSNYN